MNYQSFIRDIPDFPKKGIVFKDITPLLSDSVAFKQIINDMAAPFRKEQIDCIVAIEARGYILGAPIAYELGSGLALVRKKGKLPWETIQTEYSLEYGSATLEIHRDAIKPGQNVLIVDDILATGGTLKASIDLVEELGGSVTGLLVLAELCSLGGKAQFNGYQLVSILEL